MRKIVTSPTHSALPDRGHDFCAHYEGEEEAGNYGYGATEAAAIQDFVESCQADHDDRLERRVTATSRSLQQPRISPGMKETLDQLQALSGSQVSKPDFMAKLFAPAPKADGGIE